MPHGFEERGDLRFDARRTKGAGAMGSKHCVGSGGRVEPGQGCVMVGPEGPERLVHRASLAVAVGARSREPVAV